MCVCIFPYYMIEYKQMQVMKQFIIQFVTRRGNETYLKKN